MKYSISGYQMLNQRNVSIGFKKSCSTNFVTSSHLICKLQVNVLTLSRKHWKNHFMVYRLVNTSWLSCRHKNANRENKWTTLSREESMRNYCSVWLRKVLPFPFYSANYLFIKLFSNNLVLIILLYSSIKFCLFHPWIWVINFFYFCIISICYIFHDLLNY